MGEFKGWSYLKLKVMNMLFHQILIDYQLINKNWNFEPFGNSAQTTEFLTIGDKFFSVLHYIFENSSNSIFLLKAIRDRGFRLWYLGSCFWAICTRHNMSHTCHKHVIGELTVFQYVTTCHTFFIKVKYILTLNKELM